MQRVSLSSAPAFVPVAPLLGLAFKGNTDDLRDAPALTLIEELHRRGAVLKVHDPVAMPNARRFYPELPVEYSPNEIELARGCDAVVIVTDWDEYRRMPLVDIAAVMQGKLLLDARNLLQPTQVREAGLQYVGIGR